ncbi:DUF397 domain-containing protein [Actinomadura rubrisoli]|uniref:DUF397 domain-containing protein n=1 Tax=Actinomadura rubrisoli TaxID=2530368 RepID=A0A4R5A096_9ACTN|nr:DUF397 domain-containing protein [Actinomadura rubrisoli]TDD65111.1 DUF397 domain-containing protein [Actinomadura rubrisoli]
MKWRKSSHSTSNGENCVELARITNGVATRDSTDPDGPKHAFNVAEMAALFEAIRQGDYDL